LESFGKGLQDDIKTASCQTMEEIICTLCKCHEEHLAAKSAIIFRHLKDSQDRYCSILQQSLENTRSVEFKLKNSGDFASHLSFSDAISNFSDPISLTPLF
jgi:hypothetical protein